MSLRQLYQPLRPNLTIQDRLVDEAMWVATLPDELLAEYSPRPRPMFVLPRWLDPAIREPITIDEVLDLRSIGNPRDYNRVYNWWEGPQTPASSSQPGLQMGTW